MRCALSYDPEKTFFDQKLSAWGEMQSLNEEPGYKETDIKSDKEQIFFSGVKFAMDFVNNLADNMEEDGMISDDAADFIRQDICSELALNLFSILDNEEDE